VGGVQTKRGTGLALDFAIFVDPGTGLVGLALFFVIMGLGLQGLADLVQKGVWDWTGLVGLVDFRLWKGGTWPSNDR
jgi:hypothetical protein